MLDNRDAVDLSESERSLIESGAATLAQVVEGRRLLREANEREQLEEWDWTHCPVCGANFADSPEHCR